MFGTAAVGFGLFMVAAMPIALSCTWSSAEAQTTEDNIINKRSQILPFTNALGTQLLQKIPRNDPVEVDAVGSPSDQDVGLEIASFLRNNGYAVSTLRIGAISPHPEGPVTLINGGWKWYVEVDPSVR